MSRLWTLSILAFPLAALAEEPTYDPTKNPPTPTTTTPNTEPQPWGQDQTRAGDHNDGELAQILQHVNNAEIEASRFALTKVKNPALKQFSQMVIDAHTANQRELQRIMGNASIAADQGKEAMHTQKKLDKMVTDLRSKDAKDFDKAYADAQIQMHQDALDIIEDKLIEHASNPELRAHFEATRSKVSAHLDRAKAIKKQELG